MLTIAYKAFTSIYSLPQLCIGLLEVSCPVRAFPHCAVYKVLNHMVRAAKIATTLEGDAHISRGGFESFAHYGTQEVWSRNDGTREGEGNMNTSAQRRQQRPELRRGFTYPTDERYDLQAVVPARIGTRSCRKHTLAVPECNSYSAQRCKNICHHKMNRDVRTGKVTYDIVPCVGGGIRCCCVGIGKRRQAKVPPSPTSYFHLRSS